MPHTAQQLLLSTHKAANSQALSQTAGTATGTYASVGTTAPAVVFPLTTGADVKTFGSGNDTINALYASATGMTFQATDSLDGGTGSDTINIQVGATGTHAAASMVGIETVSANFSAAGTVSLLNSTGVTTVESSASTAAAAFSNIGSVATALKVSNTAQDATFGLHNRCSCWYSRHSCSDIERRNWRYSDFGWC